MRHLARVEDNKIIFDDKEVFKYETNKYNGKKIIVELREAKNIRSLKQNSYMWGVVFPEISQHTGYTAQEVHDIICSKFLRRLVEKDEFSYEVIGGTSDLDTKEFETLMAQVREWASFELGVWIPEPNEGEFNY